MKNNGCVGCHQLGQLVDAHASRRRSGKFTNRAEAWMRRVQSGQAGALMVNTLAGQLAARRSSISATGPIASPRASCRTPSRRGRKGVERNIVVTTWDWGDPKKYLHDLIASDRRNPTVNAYGPLFGSPEYATDKMPILDPKTNTVTNFGAGARRGHAGSARAGTRGHGQAAGAVGLLGRREASGTPRSTTTTPCSTSKGRVWLAAAVRGPKNPGLLQEGLRPSLGQAVPAGAHAPRDLRSSIRRR